MVQLSDNRPQLLADRQKIDHALVLVQRAKHLGRDPVAVTVQPLAALRGGDEMGGDQNQFVAGDTNLKLRHGGAGNLLTSGYPHTACAGYKTTQAWRRRKSSNRGTIFSWASSTT